MCTVSETAIGLACSALCVCLTYGISVGVKRAAYFGLLIWQVFCVLCVCMCVVVVVCVCVCGVVCMLLLLCCCRRLFVCVVVVVLLSSSVCVCC